MSEANAAAKATDIVQAAVTESPILILPQFCPWQESVFTQGLDNLQFVVFQAPTGDWRVQTVPEELGSFTPRKALPEAWAGLRGEELSEATGVAGCIFCHNGRFIAGAKTREGAMALAEQATAFRPCNCGSGVHWAYCPANSPYCG